jgi:Tat protein secretion system quality control protein TatD with DNase activity
VAIVCIGESRAAAAGAAALAARFPGVVYATAGVHPYDAATYDAERDRAWIGAALDAGAGWTTITRGTRRRPSSVPRWATSWHWRRPAPGP